MAPLETMIMNTRIFVGSLLVTAFFLFSFAREDAFAHCDGMDGPVVKAAQTALQSSNVNLVLPWVRKEDEQLVRQAFERTLEVRKLSSTARELADQYFFETIVRIHRAGEGAPYTGLMPAGRDLGPAIPAADRATESGSSKEVEKLLSETLAHGVHEHFKMLMSTRGFDKNNVDAGREYVQQYVPWVHYVNGAYEAAAGKCAHHGDEEGTHSEHKD